MLADMWPRRSIHSASQSREPRAVISEPYFLLDCETGFCKLLLYITSHRAPIISTSKHLPTALTHNSPQSLYSIPDTIGQFLPISSHHHNPLQPHAYCACDDETHTTFAVFTRAPHRTYFGAYEGQSSLDVSMHN